jgi:hypothetical protein
MFGIRNIANFNSLAALPLPKLATVANNPALTDINPQNELNSPLNNLTINELAFNKLANNDLVNAALPLNSEFISPSVTELEPNNRATLVANAATVSNPASAEVPIISGKINPQKFYDYAIFIQRMRQNIKQLRKAASIKETAVATPQDSAENRQLLQDRMQRTAERLSKILQDLNAKLLLADEAQQPALAAQIALISTQLQLLEQSLAANANNNGPETSTTRPKSKTAAPSPADIDIYDPEAILRLRQEVFGFSFGELRV